MLSLIAEGRIDARDATTDCPTAEEKVVKKLKEQAGAHGVSMQAEHRRTLREASLGKGTRKLSFKEALLAMPDVGEDEDFERAPPIDRPVRLGAACRRATECGRFWP